MKFIDMFCGIGTIRMGFEQADHECVYSIEWDKHKRKIYSIIFGGEPEGADIATIRADELPRSDCWCFGAPCQDFSIAGKRAGLEGDRSSLVKEVFRLVRETKEEHRPKYLFYENVKGMLSSNKGFDFLEILTEMESLGYDTIEYSLLNSKDFGVPQNRERVFTVGHLRNRSARKVFPINNTYSQANGVQGQYTNTITARYEKSQATGSYVIEGKQYAQEVRACLTPDRLEKRQNGRRFKEDGEPMFTLTKQDIHGVAIYDLYNHRERKDGIIGTLTSNSMTSLTHCGSFGVSDKCRIRRLTPKECWRLQGIPDSITNKAITAGISDTQMYRGAGDATTVNVIYEIARRMS